MSHDLSNKIILVTGANSGIGYAFCEEAVRQKAARVIVAGRDESRCRVAATTLGPIAIAKHPKTTNGEFTRGHMDVFQF